MRPVGYGAYGSSLRDLPRFPIEDPVTFSTSIRVTIEHGHANKRSDDWSSVAYWYQTLPHRPFALPPAADRDPEPPAAGRDPEPPA